MNPYAPPSLGVPSRPFILLAILIAFSPRVDALEPGQIFEEASPSIVIVKALDAKGATLSLGSGVLIAPGEVITDCHVIEGGERFVVKKDDRISPAYLRFADRSRDLCQLQARLAAFFTRPVRGVVTMDDLRVGQRVYAIGAPLGLELTLSEGLISALRPLESNSIRVIEITAPISSGSSGGGLFDQDGRLVGITSFMLKESQNLNFALPAGWAFELSSRQPDQIEDQRRRRAEAETAAIASGLQRREQDLRREEATLGSEQAALQRSQRRGDGGDRERFGVEIANRAGLQVRAGPDYPREARQNGWEGTTRVTLQFGADGKVTSIVVAVSSGYDVLDDQAIEIVRRIEIPPVPDVLSGKQFKVHVPIVFKLRRPIPDVRGPDHGQQRNSRRGLRYSTWGVF